MTSSSPKAWPLWVALAIWILVFVGIMTDVVRKPFDHTTVPTYERASILWWQGQDPYNNDMHAGFLYFPQAAVIYTPFSWGPPLSNYFQPKDPTKSSRLQTEPRMGELAWRLVLFAFYAYALVRLGQVFLGRTKPFTTAAFLALSLLAAPSSLAALRNAQFDLPLATLIVMTTVEIATGQWTMAAIWLCFALALKPLAAVPLLLFGALYWKLIPRVIIGLLIVVALPFAHWSPSFVAHEYVRSWETLRWAGMEANEPRYSELFALASHIGIYPPELVKTGLRVIFALLYLGLGFMAIRNLGAVLAAWTVGALSADYLMLFNPRTETCSYVFLGPFVASLAIYYFQQRDRKGLSYVLGFAALCLACDAFPKLGSLNVHLMTDRWLKPLVALLFLPVLVHFIFTPDSKRDKSRT